MNESRINTCSMGKVTLPTLQRKWPTHLEGYAAALSKKGVLYTWFLWGQENSLNVACCLASIWEVLGIDSSTRYTYPKLLTLAHRIPTGRTFLLGEEMFSRKDLFIATFPNSMQGLEHLFWYLSHICFSALGWLDWNEDWWCLHEPHHWLVHCSTCESAGEV